jgi:hypothetical protein
VGACESQGRGRISKHSSNKPEGLQEDGKKEHHHERTVDFSRSFPEPVRIWKTNDPMIYSAGKVDRFEGQDGYCN